MNSISGIVIAKDEENMIADCLDSVSFCDEIIVVDGGSKDRTVEIVLRSKIPLRGTKRMGAEIFTLKSNDFSELRNFGLEKAKGDWVLYIDADERVTEELAQNIKRKISNPDYSSSEVRQLTDKSRSSKDTSSRPFDKLRARTIKDSVVAYRIKRKNFYLGSSKKNEWPHIEKLERLFRRESLKGWKGRLHESPVFNGEVGELDGFLLHYTHRNLSEMLAKTIEWSKIEAELRYNARHPKVTWWRLVRVMLTAFLDSYVRQKGWKAGVVGLIESIYQLFSMFITYARLWEIQQKLKVKS